jgi:hypothetical protein
MARQEEEHLINKLSKKQEVKLQESHLRLVSYS